MVRQFVVDASVVMKWLNEDREEALEQALQIIRLARDQKIFLLSPEFVACEVGNVLVKGKKLQGKALLEALGVFWELPLLLMSVDRPLMETGCFLAQQENITFYDAVYMSLAFSQQIPLVTANIKHQRSNQAIRVIPLSEWHHELLSI